MLLPDEINDLTDWPEGLRIEVEGSNPPVAYVYRRDEDTPSLEFYYDNGAWEAPWTTMQVSKNLDEIQTALNWLEKNYPTHRA